MRARRRYERQRALGLFGYVTSERPDWFSDPTVPVTGTTPRVASKCGSSVLPDPRLFAFLAVGSELVGRVLRGRGPSAQGLRAQFPTNFRSHSFLHRNRVTSSTDCPDIHRLLHRFVHRRFGPLGFTRCPTDARQRPRSDQPDDSRARRQARAWATAPGWSPCTHNESTESASRIALAAIWSSSSSTAPGWSRGRSRPSAAYPRSGKPSSEGDPAEPRCQVEQPAAACRAPEASPSPPAPPPPAPRRRSRGGRARRAASGSGPRGPPRPRSATAIPPGRRPGRAGLRGPRRGPPVPKLGRSAYDTWAPTETPSRAAPSQTERMIVALPAW